MKSTIFIFLNTLGCLALTGLVAFQWSKERASHRAVENLKTELTEANQSYLTELEKTATLERDITALKEAMESTRQAADEAAKSMASHDTKTTLLEAELTAARSQVQNWQAAIETRDAKLKELNTDLITTRRRLDESITKLKQAGAR